jgi:hypothetical protein
VLLAVIAGLLVAADLTARSLTEGELVARVRAAVPEAGATSVDIRSFPFLPRLLASGHVPQIDAQVNDVTVRDLRFDFIAVELHGVHVDRDQLVGRRSVVLESVDRGKVRAEVAQQALTDVLGVPVTLEPGRASVRIAGVSLGAKLSITDGRLVVAGLGIELPALDLSGPLLPCVADAQILDGRVALSCAFTEIPAELLPPQAAVRFDRY